MLVDAECTMPCTAHVTPTSANDDNGFSKKNLNSRGIGAVGFAAVSPLWANAVWSAPG